MSGLLEQDRALEQYSDEELLKQSIEKPHLFEFLVLRYQAPFLRKAGVVLKNKEDAEDVVLETFTKIYRNAGRFEPVKGASFSSWGYKILLNSCFTLYQKRKKERGEEVGFTDEMAELVPDQNERSERERRELSDYISSVCIRLPRELARLLTGYFLDGKSQKELAEEEGVSVAAIKTRMHRAKEAFRRASFMV